MQRTDLKRPWCWERLKVGGEGDARGWDGWMASPTQWTWVWVNSGSWLWTQKPGALQSMGSQRVRHDWATELNEALWPAPVTQVVKNLTSNAGDARDVGSIPKSERSTGGGNDNLLQYSCLENPMDRGAWWATVHRVTKSWTRLSDWTIPTTVTYNLGEWRKSLIKEISIKEASRVEDLVSYKEMDTRLLFSSCEW